jgi:hypothetical protein
MAIGLAAVLIRYAYDVIRKGAGSYSKLRVDLGRVILLGLIVIIRVVLSFALEVEISGSWPWQQRRGDQSDAA